MMHHRIDNGRKVWVYNPEIPSISINTKWLFGKLYEMGIDTLIYSIKNEKIDIEGSYPKDKIMEIKKLLYEYYPLIEQILPRKYGITIKFKVNVKYT